MLELSSNSTNSCSSSASAPNSPDQLSSNGPGSYTHPLPMINLSLNEASKCSNFASLNTFLGQSSSPLRALHSMSDLSCKLSGLSPQSLAEGASYHSLNMKSLGQVASPSSSSSSPVPCSTASSTSHYISDILNRPASFAAVPSGALSGALPRFPLGSVPGSVCFSAAANGLSHKISPLNDLQSRHLYWPSMVQNSNLWRERLASAVNQGCMEKDGKKKHTRPTFSGHQIYVLEKTFEQTKYLAGPERAKLAYALGMSESQVKVWFQNRRTKWRKRHAAELATAKKKNPNLNGADLSTQEEEYSSDEEMSEKMLKSKDQYLHSSMGVSQS